MVVLACSSDPADRSGGGDCAESPLLDEVQRDGEIRVIVSVATEPGRSTDPDHVAELEEQLLAELEPTSYEVVRRMSGIPILALRVHEAALCRLLESEFVEGVRKDVAVPPTGGTDGPATP